jgi:signal transduction histidine kinase
MKNQKIEKETNRKTDPDRIKNKNKKSGITLKISSVRWAVGLSVIATIGSVMSYGLISYSFGLLTPGSAISMIYMIVPMSALITISLKLVLKKTSQRIDQLAEAMDQVQNGDLNVSIPVEDAGEFKELYQGFNTMVKELRQTKEEMTRFTNEFAHEIKTPITSVSGFADYLLTTGKDESEERLQYLKVIRDQSKRLSDLTTNTLNLSKAEACQVVTDRTHFDITEQIRQCVILLMKEMEEKGISPVLPEAEHIYFRGNEEQLQQIWINLLKNAVKFTPSGGQITVDIRELPAGSGMESSAYFLSQKDSDSAKAEIKDLVSARANKKDSRSCIEVSIRDTGIGMTEEEMQHIFERGYQKRSTSFQGNGIGLAVVKRLVELYQGEITVDSKPGQGSAFTVRLPVV